MFLRVMPLGQGRVDKEGRAFDIIYVAQPSQFHSGSVDVRVEDSVPLRNVVFNL